MRTEEILLQNFMKENNLTSLDFSWTNSKERYYFALDLEGNEVHFKYDIYDEKIIVE